MVERGDHHPFLQSDLIEDNLTRQKESVAQGTCKLLMENRSAESEKLRITATNETQIVNALPRWDKKLKELVLFEVNKLDALPTTRHSLWLEE